MSFGDASMEGFVIHLLYYKSSFLSISELTVGGGGGSEGMCVCVCVWQIHISTTDIGFVVDSTNIWRILRLSYKPWKLLTKSLT